MRKLVILCHALHVAAGDATWFLACRHAAALIGAEFQTVSRWLGKLERDGVLKLIHRGTVGRSETARANEYRYSGDSAS
jgi:hypothetical protein